MSTKTILVFGATGPQGGGVIRSLVALNDPTPKYKVIGVTRDPASDKAAPLAALPNVELRKWEDDKLEGLFKGTDVYGVFSVQTALQARELETAIEITDLAEKYNVQHYIWNGIDFSGTTEKDTVPDHVVNKRKIEAHIHASKLAWTIFRPAWFMEAFYWEPIQHAILTVLNQDNTYKMISTEDIGRAVATAFDNKAEFVGKTISLAGDALKPRETAAVWEEVTGGPIPSVKPDFPAVFQQTFDYVNNYTYSADPAEVRKIFPWVKDFKTWLKATPFAKSA